MEPLPEHEVFAVVGEDGFRRLCRAFYAQVPEDDVLGPMYPADDMEGAEQRLSDFLIYRFGGPQKYIEERGHPRLRARHFPFKIDQAAQERWMQIMQTALEQTQLDARATATLKSFFEHMSRFLINSD